MQLHRGVRVPSAELGATFAGRRALHTARARLPHCSGSYPKTN